MAEIIDIDRQIKREWVVRYKKDTWSTLYSLIQEHKIKVTRNFSNIYSCTVVCTEDELHDLYRNKQARDLLEGQPDFIRYLKLQ